MECWSFRYGLPEAAEKGTRVDSEAIRVGDGVAYQVLKLTHRDTVVSFIRIVLAPERPHEIIVDHLELLDAEHPCLIQRDAVRVSGDQVFIRVQVMDVDTQADQLITERMPFGKLLDGGQWVARLSGIDEKLLLGRDRQVEVLLLLRPARLGRGLHRWQ